MKKYTLSILIIASCLFFIQCATDSTVDEKASAVKEKIENTIDQTTQTLKEKEAGVEEQLTTPAPNPNQTAYGLDISQFQGDEIAFLDSNKDQLSFIFCKATEGITYTDPDFNKNWTTIPEKGFIRGAYHFYRSKDDPIAQAKHFINAISDLQNEDLPPVVDFEGAGIDKSQSVIEIQKGLIQFLNYVEIKLNRTPMIYTDIPSGNKYLDNPKFAEYALWIALYEDLESPRLPNAWNGKHWYFWQKSSQHRIDGQKNDFDQFNGDLTQLQSFIKNY